MIYKIFLWKKAVNREAYLLKLFFIEHIISIYVDDLSKNQLQFLSKDLLPCDGDTCQKGRLKEGQRVSDLTLQPGVDGIKHFNLAIFMVPFSFIVVHLSTLLMIVFDVL
ncbi:hypothetical protein ACJX0J_037231, partial [Zea mays]